jgi:carboxypeptidase Taq
MENLQALKTRTADIRNVRHAAAILDWDQKTHMPKKANTVRAGQVSSLRKIAHQMFTDDEVGRLLEEAAGEVGSLDVDSDEARLVKVLQRDYEKARKLPADFVAEFARTTTEAHRIWAQARQDDNFEHFQPTLEKIVDLCRQQAEYLGYEATLYDALLDNYEPGVKTAQVAGLFDGLREELVPLAKAIFEQKDTNSDAPLRRYIPVEQQRQFGMKVVGQMGYDLERGRQDETVHPFCTSFSRNDVRITTRFQDHFLSSALFGTIHEAGHATYEQGISPELDDTLLGGGTSLGVHESQSRLWENIVGRSRGFWEYFYPQLQATVDGRLDDVDLDTFYRAINYVSPSLIRVEADEVTYCLHIMLRFEIEQDLLNGVIAVKDAPEAWNAKMQAYLGITPPDNRNGVLQDIHWSMGILGYFPTYALGTMLSAQLYERALQDHPHIPAEIKTGKFDTLLGWMNTNIHAHGRKFMPTELIQRATGKPLSHRAFMDYLRGKFSRIYDL